MTAVSNTVQLIDKTIKTLNYSFSERDDVFFTTSFGYQSALLFALLSEAGVTMNCLAIRSRLAYGGIDEHSDILINNYSFNLTVIDRNEWLTSYLGNSHFLDLDQTKRREVCRELKRKPVTEFIKRNDYGIWITGIRREQTEKRRETRFMDTTDMGVVKIAPMASWGDDDVRRALAAFDLPANNKYVDLCKYNDAKECGLHN